MGWGRLFTHWGKTTRKFWTGKNQTEEPPALSAPPVDHELHDLQRQKEECETALAILKNDLFRANEAYANTWALYQQQSTAITVATDQSAKARTELESTTRLLASEQETREHTKGLLGELETRMSASLAAYDKAVTANALFIQMQELITKPDTDPAFSVYPKEQLVRDLLASPACKENLRINKVGSDGYTLLHKAIQIESTDISLDLLRHGADPSIDFPNGSTCIYQAVLHLDVQLFRAMMEKSPPFDPAVIDAACEIGEPEIFDIAYSQIRDPDFVLRDGNTLLMSAALHGFGYGVDKLLGFGANINKPNVKGYTLLHLAIELGMQEAIVEALKARADASIPFPDGSSCAYQAAIHLNLDSVKAIVEATQVLDREILHAACIKGKADIFDWAISQVGNYNCIFRNGNTPLISAMSNRFSHAIDKLLHLGVDVNIANPVGETPLLWAAKINCADYVRELLDHGANTSGIDSNQENALHFFVRGITGPITLAKDASFLGSTVHFGFQTLKPCNVILPNGMMMMQVHGGFSLSSENTIGIGLQTQATISTVKSNANFEYALSIMKLLVERGLDITSSNLQGQTPFMLACNKQLFYFAKQLVNSFDIGLNKVDHQQNHSIHYAIRSLDPELIDLMVKKGATIDAQDSLGRTVLHYAVIHNHLPCVQKILELGADPLISATCGDGYKPIHIAALLGNIEIVKALIPSSGLDVESSMKEMTPFLAACTSENSEVVTYFLEDLGVSANSCSSIGRSALIVALNHQKNNNARILISKGADINCTRGDVDGWTPLHMAAYFSNLEGLKMLIDAGATTINTQDLHSVTPLHLLITHYNTCNTVTAEKNTCIEYLLSKGANPNIPDKDGKNCFDLSRELLPEVFEMLLPFMGTASYNTPLELPSGVGAASVAADLPVTSEEIAQLVQDGAERSLADVIPEVAVAGEANYL